MTTKRDVIEFIVTSATTEDVNDIWNAAKQRTRMLSAQRTAVASAAFKVGDRVRTTNIRPKYLDGVTGTIQGKRGTKFTVALDAGFDTGRFSQTVNVPAGCLVAV